MDRLSRGGFRRVAVGARGTASGRSCLSSGRGRILDGSIEGESLDSEVVQARLDKLLAEKTPKVAMLTGAWGSGKTYQWKQALERAAKKGLTTLPLRLMTRNRQSAQWL